MIKIMLTNFPLPGIVSGMSESNTMSVAEMETSRSGMRVGGRFAYAPGQTAPGVRIPHAEQLEYIERMNRSLENATPEEILAWAVETYFPRFTMATGLGPEGCVIISMLAKIEPRVYVFNLDTGYQFRETLDLRDRIAEKYGMTIDLQRPELSVERVRGGPRRPGLQDRSGSLLPRPQGGRVAPRGGGVRRLGHRHPPRPISHPRRHADRPLGQEIRPGEDQPLGRLDEEGRLGPDPQGGRALQSAARPGVSEHRLLALHAGGGSGEDERAGRWSGSARPSAACTRREG